MDSKIFLCLLGLAVCVIASPGPHPGDDKPTEMSPPSNQVVSSESLVAKENKCIDGRLQEEVNKKVVEEFLLRVFNDQDLEDAESYFYPDYIEHNPAWAGGTKNLKEEFATFLKSVPKGQLDIRKLQADGDYVWTHLKFPKPNDPGKFVSIMDCFRMENGFIKEHWDALTPLPELKDSKNPHPLF